MDEYQIRRAAVEVERKTLSPHELEIKRIENLRKHFGWLNLQWIGVSFVHMAITMLLFGDGGAVTTAALLVMVLGIDLALMWLSTYIELQRRAEQPIGFFPWSAFVVALFVELGFNTAALWSHRPPPDQFPDGASKALAVTFGTFVALIIYVSATVQAKLDRTLMVIHANEVKRQQMERQREEQRRKREEDEEYRRQRREERIQIMPLESHNEAVKALAPPDEAMLYQRQGNGKADIAANDVPAILAALHAAGVTQLDSAAKLREVCGWSSYSTATKARDILLEAGALREVAGGGFAVVRNGGNQ